MLYTEVAEGSEPIRVPLDAGIVGYVARVGELLNIKDVYADSRFSPENDKATGYRTKSMLTCPIKNAGDSVLGVLQIINKRSAECFDADDEAMLRALCDHVSLAVESFKTEQQSKEKIENSLKSLKDFDEKLKSAREKNDDLESEIGKRNVLLGELETLKRKAEAENHRLQSEKAEMELSLAAKERLESVVEAAKILQGALNQERLVKAVEEDFPRLVGCDEMRLYMVEDSLLQRAGGAKGGEDSYFVGRCYKSKKVVHGLDFHDASDQDDHHPYALCAPLVLTISSQPACVGVLHFIKRAEEFSKDDVLVATRLAVFVARAAYTVKHNTDTKLDKQKLRNHIDNLEKDIAEAKLRETASQSAIAHMKKSELELWSSLVATEELLNFKSECMTRHHQ